MVTSNVFVRTFSIVISQIIFPARKPAVVTEMDFNGFKFYKVTVQLSYLHYLK